MFTIYSKENCSQCDQAKIYLTLKGISFNTLMLDVDFSKSEFVEKFPNARSFPVVTKDGNCVGGLNELKSLLKGV